MTTKVKKLKITVSSGIESLVPYPPGKPIEELERELGITGSIKLASNENPLGPSKKAVAAVSSALNNLHRYPDGSGFYLKEKLSSRLNVPTDMIILGNGSNEIIELLIRTFLRPGDETVMADPSFAVYPLVTKAAGGSSILVPLDKGFRHDLPAMAKAITEKTRIVFIANPNNPTGTVVSKDEFRAFMKDVPDEVIVCVDEAYCEFVRRADFPETIEYVRNGLKGLSPYPVVALRTFSKIYGLAGLRCGYGVADARMINYMDRVRQPFNVNSLALAAALAALDDGEHLKATLENNKNGLDYLFNELKSFGFEVLPTEANFFLIKVGDGKSVYNGLLKKGVIVRPMASYGLPEYIRVTVGLPEENRRFIKAFKEII
ncbi:MAG: histidinol-phosphate transaminase [Deltaproteobacteria bacterium]|nr:histidinol-phosphate transaminase [Deltaproteobacteria bacterium]